MINTFCYLCIDWRFPSIPTTCWPATAHDVTTGVPQYKCHRENTSSAFSSSLTGFLSIKWRALARRLRLCVDPRPRYKIGTHRDDTHNLCVFCLGKEHARDVLEGKSACTVSFFYESKSSALVLSLFSRKEGQPSASRDSGPTAAEARR